MALLAVWSFGNASSGAGVETPWITTNVEYTVTDAMGKVKAHEFFHNRTVDNLLEDAEDRISATATVAAADVYTAIALCTNNPNTGGSDGDSAAACTLIADANVDENNPVLAGSVNAGAATYNVVHTFNATGGQAGMDIRELQLVKAPTNNTPPTAAQIGAVRDVVVDLAPGDNIQITWTVTIG